jgi:cob(I)alamin adenosyltransferase
MKIYTRTGDAGDTALFGGGRVPKDHLRIRAYGTVDETNAFLGLARSHVRGDGSFAMLDDMLERVQNELFVVGADLATPAESKASVPRVGPSHIEALERDIDRLDADLPELRRFILPGGHPCAATLHAVRTVCRRAEREIVTAFEDPGVSRNAAVYLNRLSDFLFVAARWANRAAGLEDASWTP